MNHNYSTWLNLLYLLFIVWPEGEPIAVIPLKKATLLTPNKGRPRALQHHFLYLRFSKQEMQVPLACFWSRLLTLCPKTEFKTQQEHSSSSQCQEGTRAQICEARGSTQCNQHRMVTTYSNGTCWADFKGASCMLLQIIICWGSLQNLSPLSVLQTK